MKKIAWVCLLTALFAVLGIRTAHAQPEDGGAPNTGDAGTPSTGGDAGVPSPVPAADAGAPGIAAMNVVTLVRSVEVNVCLPEDDRLIPSKEDVALAKATKEDCANGGALIESQTRSEIQPRIRNKNYVVVYVGDGSKSLGATGITEVSYSVHKEGATGAPIKCEDNDTEWADKLFRLCKLDTSKFPSASHGDVVEFNVTSGSGTARRFGRFSRPFSLASSVAGFWIPVGMFGSNFRTNEDGITLAALPIGLAFGGQYNFQNGHHLGISVFASWAIAPQKTATATNGNYTVASISPGAFLDIDGFAYLGYGYAADFRDGHKDPGHMMVLGVGPKLLEFLKGSQ